MRIFLLVVIAAGAIWAGVSLLKPPDKASVVVVMPDPQTLHPDDILTYSELVVPTYRVWTTKDVLPGGFSAAMLPAIVQWPRSDLRLGGAIMLRNVNDAGNPVSGVTVLRSALVRPDMVKRVEFILVPLGGPGHMISHGQLRFIFEDGGAEFVGAPEVAGQAETLSDLVLSWEAWRAPGVDFDAKAGMAPGTFELSMRAYSGPQRFLEDALGERDWFVYELSLPGGQAGMAELLKVSLALGDGSARYSLNTMLAGAEQEWLSEGPSAEAHGGDAIAEWELIRQMVEARRLPVSDERLDMEGKTGYQSALRSCATMALYCVNAATARLIEAGSPHDDKWPTQNPDLVDEPDWMPGLADANVAGLFARGPAAIRWARANPSAVPGNIPKELDKAGLLVRGDDGKPVETHFSMANQTPWGHRWQLLIR